MNRTLVAAVAAGLVATAGAARADFGGVPPDAPPPAPSATPYGPHAEGVYGVHPMLRWMGFWKKGWGKCAECAPQPTPIGSVYDIPRREFGPGGAFGPGGPGLGGPPGAGLPGTPPGQMPGTLVFPQHPLIRSPRDFFMYEPGGR